MTFDVALAFKFLPWAPEDPHRRLERFVEFEYLKQGLRRLTPREESVIDGRLQGKSYKELGGQYGCSPSRVSQLEAKATRKLREFICKRRLQDGLPEDALFLLDQRAAEAHRLDKKRFEEGQQRRVAEELRLKEEERQKLQDLAELQEDLEMLLGRELLIRQYLREWLMVEGLSVSFDYPLHCNFYGWWGVVLWRGEEDIGGGVGKTWLAAILEAIDRYRGWTTT